MGLLLYSALAAMALGHARDARELKALFEDLKEMMLEYHELLEQHHEAAKSMDAFPIDGVAPYCETDLFRRTEERLK